ncbi:hypothetical protein IE53DRAFT_140097 [Violaceomyces palustris]|uniref:Uncharacterized protein n=1 Tax=Violaceomyces palustris TaxID=1673888 RepID=A0ACD0NUH3_9BASI|nr:hypothetical protein IE53DRAFT_140097 [Violaceomyces palustris]
MYAHPGWGPGERRGDGGRRERGRVGERERGSSIACVKRDQHSPPPLISQASSRPSSPPSSLSYPSPCRSTSSLSACVHCILSLLLGEHNSHT